MGDVIQIENLAVFAFHGVYPEETKLGQKFLLSLTLHTDTRKAGRSDDLKDSIHYGELASFASQYTVAHPCKLIEAAAEQLAEAILLRYPKLRGVTLELKKPWAPVGLPLETVSVKISRFRHRVYLAMGSNLGDRKGYLDGAVRALDATEGCHVAAVSGYIETAPYGGVEQGDFLNACTELETLLTPEELLEQLNRIEKKANRERTIHWGPRTLDLDILFYDDLILETDRLVIPHTELHKRTFVLEPLKELAPNKRHPILKKTVLEMLRECEQTAL